MDIQNRLVVAEGEGEGTEDMGVDLYVLERAFISTHVQAKDLV